MDSQSPLRHIQIRSWNREYSQKGSLWHGPAHLDFEIPQGARVLELGCGNGKTLSALLKADCRITAIDASMRAVEMCKKLAHENGRDDVCLLVADTCSLPFPPETFDAVLASHVLEHLLEEDRKIAVSEIKRVLKKRGRVFVKVFSTADMRFGKGKEIEKNTFLRGPNRLAYHYFTEDELRTLFSDFTEISMRHIQFDKKYGDSVFVRHKILGVWEKR
ncbi:MAG: class I SAM-dependent methyltransferase [Candidatus Micrarchaeia archaeon]